MEEACRKLDNLVKDYLHFRGFISTYKTFEQELKNDKNKGFRADRITDHLMSYINSHDLDGFREYWAYLNGRYFSLLEQRYAASVRKLEAGLLKLFVVIAHQYGKQNIVKEFFLKTGAELQNQQEFKEWFVFQFLPNPVENTTFSMYFTKKWQETIQLSLHNFFHVIFHAMPAPPLLKLNEDLRRIEALEEENKRLKDQLQRSHLADEPAMKSADIVSLRTDFPYDFISHSDHATVNVETVDELHKPNRFPVNSLTRFFKRNKPSTSQPSTTKLTPSVGSGSVNASNRQQCFHTVSSSLNAGLMVSSGLPVCVSCSTHVPFSCDLISTATVSSSVGTDLMTHRHVAMFATLRETAIEEEAQCPNTSPQSTRNNSSSASVCVSCDSVCQSLWYNDQTELVISCGDEHLAKEDTTSEQLLKHCNIEITKKLTGRPCPFLVLSDDEYHEHRSAVRAARFSPSGQAVSSLDMDGVVKLWTWSPQLVTVATLLCQSPFLSFAWAGGSDRWLLLGNTSNKISLFDTSKLKSSKEVFLDLSYSRVNFLAACMSNMTFVSCHSDGIISQSPTRLTSGQLVLWDSRTMTMMRHLNEEPIGASVLFCTFSPDGRLLLAAGVDGAVCLYDVGRRRCVRRWLCGRGGESQTVVFSRSVDSFYAMRLNTELQEWSLSSHSQPIRQIVIADRGTFGLPGNVESDQRFCFCQDEKFFVTSVQRRGLLCQLADGQCGRCCTEILSLHPHSDLVTTVDWSCNVDIPACLTAAQDGCVRVATLLSQ